MFRPGISAARSVMDNDAPLLACLSAIADLARSLDSASASNAGVTRAHARPMVTDGMGGREWGWMFDVRVSARLRDLRDCLREIFEFQCRKLRDRARACGCGMPPANWKLLRCRDLRRPIKLRLPMATVLLNWIYSRYFPRRSMTLTNCAIDRVRAHDVQGVQPDDHRAELA